jgi:hypothetical protein
MKTQIQPFLIGLPQKEAISISVNTLLTLGDTTSQSYWALYDSAEQQIASGSLPIPEEIHSQWGTDDSVILDYILLSLGLTKLTE